MSFYRLIFFIPPAMSAETRETSASRVDVSLRRRLRRGESGGSLLGPVAPDDSVSGVLASCRAVKGIGKWRES
jgi:hypothetical protein